MPFSLITIVSEYGPDAGCCCAGGQKDALKSERVHRLKRPGVRRATGTNLLHHPPFCRIGACDDAYQRRSADHLIGCGPRLVRQACQDSSGYVVRHGGGHFGENGQA